MNLKAVSFYESKAIEMNNAGFPTELRDRGVSDVEVNRIDAVRQGVYHLAEEVRRLRRLVRKHGGRP